MAKKFKKTLAMLLTVLMMTNTMSMTVFAEETDTADLVLNGETITGTITEDMVWENGDVVSGVTINDGVTITVKGTVTVAGTIRPGNNVTFVGEGDSATLIRGKLNAESEAFTGQMFYVEGTICDFPNLTFNNITLDGGAVWTGEVDPILGRGTTNEGVKATGSVLYLVRANATLNNATLQNHDDGIGERANAVFLREYATVAFNNSVARNNNSPSGYWKGGVVSTRYGGTVTANNSEVYGNSASYGGFVGVSSSGSYGVKVECKDTVIRNNYASTAGAAFYLQDNYGSITKTHGDNSHGVLKLDGCTLEKNGSPDGLIYSYVYYTPAWIEDTTIADNECAVYTYGTNENRSFSVAGNTQVSSGAFDGVLYETPVRIYGELDSGASILMNRASVDYLMNKYGYLATAVPAISEHYNHTSTGTYVVTYEYTSDALYDMTLADLAQIKLPEDSGYTGWVLTDVDGNGMLDAVPVSDASAVVENVPICDDEKPGYFFAGWSEGEDGAQTATWKVARPQVSLTPATYVNVLTAGDSITLTAAVDNENSNLTYAYQWYRDNVAIEGATGTVYTATEANAGDYVYKCVVTATDANCGTNTYNKSILLHYDAPEYVCYIKETGVYYTTLTEAVADANALEGANTIVMIKDIDFDSDKALSVTGDLTIIGEQTISRGAYTGTLFTVPAGSSLTLDGGIVFDGSNNWIFDKELYENDLYNRVDNPIAAYAYSAEGGTVGTAAAFVVNGTVTANDATFRNFFSTKDSNAGDAAIFKVNANAVLDTNGALIDHNATYGANTVAHLATNAKWYIQGETMISNNFGGRNGGMCRNDSGQIYMSGGTVKDNAGKNVNGTFIMMYGTGSAFYMTGGTICGNSSVFGVNNGRCAAVYLHSGSYMKMTGGIICHNVGGSRGGIDSYAANSVLDINRVDQVFVDGVYANENGKDAYNPDNHPMVVDNVSLIGNDTHDVGRTYSTESWWVTGGIYTQDVDKFCAKGYICIPYEDTERTDDYIVVPGYRVNYYAVEEVETQKDVIDESGAVVGTEPVVELQTTLVYKYFHMLPRDKFWYEMDERANYFELTNDEGSTISTWYTEKELANIYDFDTELKSDLNLYGEWEAPYVPVHTLGSIVVNKTTTGAATPADAAFQLQKMEGNDWVNVGEAVAFSQFVDGAYTFTGLEEGTYRIVESGAEVEGYTLETTYSANVVLTKTTAENGDTSVSNGNYSVTNKYEEIEEDDLIEIPDEDVPLDNAPDETGGDPILPFFGMAIASGAAAIFVGKIGKKKEDEE